MPWQIIPTNDYNNLIPTIAAHIRKRTLARPAIIVVPNKVVKTWIRQALAQHIGNVMAVTFMEEFAARRYFCGLPDEHTCHDVLLETLVADVLDDIDETDVVWRPVNAWLAANRGSRMELAGQLTRLLRFYDKQRPSMLVDFINGAVPKLVSPDIQWQAELVQRVWARGGLATPIGAMTPVPLSETRVDESGPIVIVGGAFLPLIDYRWVQALAAKPQIHILQVLLSPCRHFFADNPTRKQLMMSSVTDDGSANFANPVLSSLGLLSRNEQAYLIDTEDELLRDGVDVHTYFGGEAFREPRASTKLGALQLSILDNTPCISLDVDSNKIDDDSLVVNSCWSAIRELECVRDDILLALHDDPTLHPRDVIITAPDLAPYLPHIERVFSSPVDLPWALIGDGVSVASPVPALFQRILDNIGGRLRRSDLLGIVQNPCWLAKHGLEPDDIDALKVILAEGGARYGFSLDDRLAELEVVWHGVEPDASGTWDEWLDRVAMGLVIAPTDEFSPLESSSEALLGVGGVGAVESRSLGNVVGPLSDLLHLMTKTAVLNQPIAAWIVTVSEIIDQQIGCRSGQPSDDDHITAIRFALASLAKQCDRVDVSRDYAISLQDFRVLLRQRLVEQGTPRGRALFEAISVIPLAQARGISGRVVCILGMSQDTFPTRRQPLGFDLTQVSAKHYSEDNRLDASPAQIDRLALLEVITTAVDKLWFYFTGRDATNATHRDMAVPLRDIVDAFPENMPNIIVSRAAFPWFERTLYDRDRRVRFGADTNMLADDLASGNTVNTGQGASRTASTTMNVDSTDQTQPILAGSRTRVSAKSFEDLFINPARHHLSAGRDLRIANVENPEEDDTFAPDIRDIAVKRVWDEAMRQGLPLTDVLGQIWDDIRREALVTQSNATFMRDRTSERLSQLDGKLHRVQANLGALIPPVRFASGQVPGVVGNVRDTWENGFVFTVNSGKPSDKHDRYLWRALARWLFLPIRPKVTSFSMNIVNLRDPSEDLYSLNVPLDSSNYDRLQKQFIEIAEANHDVCIPVYVHELKVHKWTVETPSIDFDSIEGELDHRVTDWDVETRRYLDQQTFTRTSTWDTFIDIVKLVNQIAPKPSKDNGTKDA
jgi:exonuclease V gamma subunit